MFWPREIWSKYVNKLEVHLFYVFYLNFPLNLLEGLWFWISRKGIIPLIVGFSFSNWHFWIFAPQGLKIWGKLWQSSTVLEWYGHQCSDACGRLFEVHVCFKGSCYIPILCYPSGALLLVYSDLRINLGILVSTFIFNCYNTIHPKLNLPSSKIGVRWMNPWPLASTGRGQTNWAVPLGESGISTSKWFLYCFIFSSWLHLLELQHDSMSLQIIFPQFS